VFKIIKHVKVYESNWLTVYEDLLDSGQNTKRQEVYNKIVTFDTSHIIPILDDANLLMVETYRNGAGKRLLELPGGFLNAGERPRDAAKRELLEETGYSSKVMKYLTYSYTWPDRSTQKNYIFCATGLTKIEDPKPEPFEQLKTIKLSRKQIANEILSGRIKSASVISAVFMSYLLQGINLSIPARLRSTRNAPNLVN
jgi:ADP-ribose pyrophosphatase